MIRRRGSVPIAENISAYLATFPIDLLDCATGMFRYLQKYGLASRISRISALTENDPYEPLSCMAEGQLSEGGIFVVLWKLPGNNTFSCTLTQGIKRKMVRYI